MRHGLWLGIAIASSSAVLLRPLICRFSALVVVARILLAATYGILYLWTGSFYLMGTRHAVLNPAPQLLEQ